jgi:hypothetical protein
VHVNFGQMGFVFIEANVKKWGLAPMTGSLAPPPPYGSEQGSILLETGREGTQQAAYQPGHSRTRSGLARLGLQGPPARAPTEISLAQLAHVPSQESSMEPGSRYASMDLSDVQHQPIENTPQGQQIIPPPEYSSPPRSRRSTRSGQDRGDDTTEEQRREREQTPIPSYDAAMEGSRSLRDDEAGQS